MISLEKYLDTNKETRFKTSMLLSELCDDNDAYIVVRGTSNVTYPNNNAYDKKLALNNKAPFITCISKINNMLTDDSEDLDIVMSVYNLIEYSKHSEATGSLWNYCRDGPNSGTVRKCKLFHERFKIF